jgi:2-polyprenyl-3-methyl-5-hydroxy-6-metoxy-1,4-benzoquinol methylase
MEDRQTREPQYQRGFELNPTRLGVHINQTWQDDPRRLGFYLSRYKFVSKMLSGKGKVLEVGCGDAFATRVVLQEVGAICAVDFDPAFVRDANDRMEEGWEFECRVHDMLDAPVEGAPFDAAYTLDVLEHIPESDEDLFVGNIARSLGQNGVVIIGTPSIQSQAYASESSRIGHVNCKSHSELKALMDAYFHNTFIFSMNDEVVHTGYYPMAQYLLGMGVGVR